MKIRDIEILKKMQAEFFPPICSICLYRLADGNNPQCICSQCLSQLPLRSPEHSFTYLRNPSVPEDERKIPFYTAFYYEEGIRKAIRELKFHNRKDFGVLLGDLLAIFYLRERRVQEDSRHRFLEVDAIVPIPLHHLRQRERGYNQVSCIIEQTAKRLGIPFEPNLLERYRATSRQSETKTREERLQNVFDCFRLRESGQDLSGKRYLLVDDVSSTGQTLWQAAVLLLDAGAQVTVMTVAGNQIIESNK